MGETKICAPFENFICIRVTDNNSHGNFICKKLHEQTRIKKDAQKEQFFDCLLIFNIFDLNICQFLRSLKTGALGYRLSRYGLATALYETVFLDE